MIKIENTDVYGWEATIRGMRNPMNSHNKSDTKEVDIPDLPRLDYYGKIVEIVPAHKQIVASFKENEWNGIGENDLALMKRLATAGNDHGKFMRMITVTCDIVAPLYWWKEFDTYKVGTVANSCSTMHKIADKEFTLDDFSCEHLDDKLILGLEVNNSRTEDDLCITAKSLLGIIVSTLNCYRTEYLKTSDKLWWWQMIQLLPCSYNQRRTVQLNYAVLKNMYHARKKHKLDEWHNFCYWIEKLPYSELITGEKENECK